MFSNINIVHGQEEYTEALKVCQKLDYFESIECMLGKQIFDFEGETVNGDLLSIKKLKGEVVVVNLWFTSCPPCVAELKGLNEIVDEFANKEVAFISFTTDSKEDLEMDFFPNYEFKFQIVSDAKGFISKGIEHRWGFPTTFIVDKEGVIQKIFTGGSSEEELATKEIKRKIIPELEKYLKD